VLKCFGEQSDEPLESHATKRYIPTQQVCPHGRVIKFHNLNHEVDSIPHHSLIRERIKWIHEAIEGEVEEDTKGLIALSHNSHKSIPNIGHSLYVANIRTIDDKRGKKIGSLFMNDITFGIGCGVIGGVALRLSEGSPQILHHHLECALLALSHSLVLKCLNVSQILFLICKLFHAFAAVCLLRIHR
jgi:hypothetical protein